jgi:hypothetical protein
MSLFILKSILFASFVIIMPLFDNNAVLRDITNKGHITTEWHLRPVLLRESTAPNRFLNSKLSRVDSYNAC